MGKDLITTDLFRSVKFMKFLRLRGNVNIIFGVVFFSSAEGFRLILSI